MDLNKIPSKETMEFIERLTPEELASLKEGLINKAKKEARSMAITLGSAFVANLRVAGYTIQADAVDEQLKIILGLFEIEEKQRG